MVCTADPLPPGDYDVAKVRVKRLRQLTRVYGTPIQAGLFKYLSESEADIFHANFPSPYLAFNASLTSFYRKIPAVITWHNDLPAVTPAARFLVETHNRIFLPRYMREYRRIIATSETYRRKSSILRNLGPRVEVISNGVDCERFHPGVDTAAIANKFRIEGKISVLFVGALTRWHGYKGLDVLLRAMQLVVKSMPGVVLLVVGEGDMRPRYESLANELGLRDKVIFAGDVPDEELPEFYAVSNLVAVPSKDMSEGFGLTVLEANASGRPCVASNTGGLTEIVRDGCNGLLVPPNDPQALAQVILSLSTDQDARSRMGKNGREFALTHDWKIVAEKTESLYLAAIST